MWVPIDVMGSDGYVAAVLEGGIVDVMVSDVGMAAGDRVIVVWLTAVVLMSDACLAVGDEVTIVWVHADVTESGGYVVFIVEGGIVVYVTVEVM
jgi:hypothetical protein